MWAIYTPDVLADRALASRTWRARTVAAATSEASHDPNAMPGTKRFRQARIEKKEKISSVFVPVRRGCGSGSDCWLAPVPSRKIRHCERAVARVRDPCLEHVRWPGTAGIGRAALRARRLMRCGSAISCWPAHWTVLCSTLHGRETNSQLTTNSM